VEDRLEPTNILLCGPWGSAGVGSVGVGERGNDLRMELDKGGEWRRRRERSERITVKLNCLRRHVRLSCLQYSIWYLHHPFGDVREGVKKDI
jgi:hypothetical protein